ncbi:MAG TPA: hypothetical protein PLA80_04095 [Synergistaceae bacterium]|nr:hypothetical protein [Synergistaceae bacterium]
MIHLVEELEKAAEKAFGRIAFLERQNRELSEKVSSLELTLLEKEEELEKVRQNSSATEHSIERVQHLEEERGHVQGRLENLLNRYRTHIQEEEKNSSQS